MNKLMNSRANYSYQNCCSHDESKFLKEFVFFDKIEVVRSIRNKDMHNMKPEV